MEIWEVLLIGVALSMDAFAVGMTNGMTEPRMRARKMLFVAGAYAFFQFLMPVLGYYGSSVFSAAIAKIAPWLSFALLGFIGGKMIFDFVKSARGKSASSPAAPPKPLGAGKLFVQAVATSIDALAVGIAMLAAETEKGLPMHIALCALVIGAINFALSFSAVALGKKIGDRFSEKAELLGGVILLAIGVKILLESLL